MKKITHYYDVKKKTISVGEGNSFHGHSKYTNMYFSRSQ